MAFSSMYKLAPKRNNLEKFAEKDPKGKLSGPAFTANGDSARQMSKRMPGPSQVYQDIYVAHDKVKKVKHK